MRWTFNGETERLRRNESRGYAGRADQEARGYASRAKHEEARDYRDRAEQEA